jgi:two-component system alkaline phosphatase synthesis response regulator PhoP
VINLARTILVVDDEKDIVEMLRYNLQKEGYQVLVAPDGKRALEMSLKLPDLILLDVMLPELDGWEVARRLRSDKKTSQIPIVFLTARTNETDEVVGLELGADDYIVKPISLPKLMARIRAVFRRREASAQLFEKDVIHIGEIEINRLNYTVHIGSREVVFPKKEFEILAYLAQHQSQVVTREMLLNAVWGDDVYVVDRTVDVHISKVREKLGQFGDWIETVKGVGYRIKQK